MNKEIKEIFFGAFIAAIAMMSIYKGQYEIAAAGIGGLAGYLTNSRMNETI